MPIDIIGKQILNDIKTLPGCDKAIIAGGFCRDAILGGDWKDVDIYVPSKGFKKFDLPKHYDWYRIPKETYAGQLLKQVLDICYLGAVNIQLIAYDLPEKNFGKNLVDQFNYGIDQAWTEDGETIHRSDRFLEDEYSSTITLLKECSIDELPKVIDKYLRLKKKYDHKYDFRFKCPNLFWKKTPAIGKQNIKEVETKKDWRKGKDFLKKHWWEALAPGNPVDVGQAIPLHQLQEIQGAFAQHAIAPNPPQAVMNQVWGNAIGQAIAGEGDQIDWGEIAGNIEDFVDEIEEVGEEGQA